MKPVIASIASREATSPALWPPMPSATANRRTSGSDTNVSSFVLRTRPASDTPQARTTVRILLSDYRGRAVRDLEGEQLNYKEQRRTSTILLWWYFAVRTKVYRRH